MPQFHPLLGRCSQNSLCSQRDEDINAQRGMRGTAGSAHGQNREEGATSHWMDVVMTV